MAEMRVLALWLALGAMAPLAAAPDPFLEPANMGARFLFHGGGAISPDTVTALRRLCRSEGEVALALPGGSGEDRDWWAARGFQPAPPAEARAIWLRTEEGFTLEGLGAETRGHLRDVLVRGGVLAVSGPGCAVFAGEGFLPAPEVPLLPYAFVETGFVRARREALRERVNARPGWVGYGLPEASAMAVDGRTVRVLGEKALTVCLPTSEHRRGNFRLVRPAFNTDHLAQVRAARARVLAPAFPPEEFPPISVPSGTLMIVGGGSTPSRILRAFVEAADGKPILVVPTAEADVPESPDAVMALFRKYGAKEVRSLHARTAAEAEDPDFLARIDGAGGIWFNGGRQWRLVDRYAGTRAHDAMRRLLGRGGVIGGTSAGATICGDYLVRGNPLGPDEMMCEGYERGLGFLPGTAIDQHVRQRNRFADMEALKTRYPQLLGLGLDEATAVIVRGDVLEAVGRGNVYLYSGSKPETATNVPRVILGNRERYSLATRAVLAPPSAASEDFGEE